MRYRFDAFEIDAERYELQRGGEAQPVEPLVFDLLLFFVRNPGRVLSRDAIVDQVWQGRAVSEATISSAIKSARRALGDDGGSQPLSVRCGAVGSNSVPMLPLSAMPRYWPNRRQAMSN